LPITDQFSVGKAYTTFGHSKMAKWYIVSNTKWYTSPLNWLPHFAHKTTQQTYSRCAVYNILLSKLLMYNLLPFPNF